MATPDMVPFGFQPDTGQFRALLRGCAKDVWREKFRGLEGLSPRALRAEVGSAARLVNAVFQSPAFLARCRPGFDIGAFLRLPRARLITERGDESEDVGRTVMGAINLLVTECHERRLVQDTLTQIVLDECTNAKTAGLFEERKAGETRKYGLSWKFLTQWANFPNRDGFFANCQRKEVFRSSYDVARLFAPMIAAGLPATGESRAVRIEAIASDITTSAPGWRWVIERPDRGGTRKEYVPMFRHPLPDWPGLREGLLREKLCRIYERPEYRGGSASPSGLPSGTPTGPRSSGGSSPAERKQRRRRPPADSWPGRSGGEPSA